jgi:hypothetical protein
VSNILSTTSKLMTLFIRLIDIASGTTKISVGDQCD